MRKLRCKSGDFAVVIYDTFSCADNIGRIVRVRGPIEYNWTFRKYCWLIRPVNREPYCIDRRSGTHRKLVRWADNVEHPDAWLLPLRPDATVLLDAIRRTAIDHLDCAAPAVLAHGVSRQPGVEVEFRLRMLELQLLRARHLP
jgi:hypothetical protein